MFTDLTIQYRRVGATRTLSVLQRLQHWPEAIGVHPDDAEGRQWAEEVRRGARTSPLLIATDAVAPGQALVAFSGSDGMLMLLIETLRNGARASVQFASHDEPGAWWSGREAVPSA